MVAAFLMSTKNLDATQAIQLIQLARPRVEPNYGFLNQLKIYHKAAYQVSQNNKHIRNFYLARLAKNVVSGDTSGLGTGTFAELAPSLRTVLPIPVPGLQPRFIRCKMCRRELAAREHMMEHNISQPTPIALSPSIDMDLDLPIPMEPGWTVITTSMEAALSETSNTTSSSSSSFSMVPTPNDIQQAVVVPITPPPPSLLSPAQIAAQLPTSLAALRTRGSGPPLGLVARPSPAVAVLRSKSPLSPSTAGGGGVSTTSILLDPKCSGYFLEPLKWMELKEGQVAGKILCPNRKCKAKLGNYDWVGLRCGCGDWVVPGFCISRSKVDEVH